MAYSRHAEVVEILVCVGRRRDFVHGGGWISCSIGFADSALCWGRVLCRGCNRLDNVAGLA